MTEDRLAYAGAVLALVFAFGFWAGREAGPPPAPACPTEDSCRVDYFDGAWHITNEEN